MDIRQEAAVLGESGSQVLKATYLIELYPVHVDLLFAVASDHNFALIGADLHFICI